MSRRSLLITGTVAVALLAIGGSLLGRRNPPATDKPVTSPVSLHIDTKQLDFGEVWETDRFEKTLQVENRGTKAVRVTALSAACGCTTPGAQAVTIPGGNSAEVTFELDLRGRCAGAPHLEPRLLKLPIGVAIDSPHAKLSWEVRVRVRPTVVLPVCAIDFGRVPAASPVAPRVIPVTAAVALSELTVATEGLGFRAELTPTTDPRKWDLVVRAAAGLLPARYTSKLVLKPVTTAGESLPPLRLPIELDLLADVQPDTAVVALGSYSVSATAEGQITLTSLSNRPFTLSQSTVSPPGSADVVFERHAVPTAVVQVRQRANAAGDQRTRVELSGTTADGTSFSVPVELHSYRVQD